MFEIPGAATADPATAADIERLKRELNAVILAHFYQEPAIQDLADHVGDSLFLAQRAAETDAEVIVFAGVHFMAETAKILNPDKQVLVPDLEAGCSLADGCPADEFSAWLAQYPGHKVVSYINCAAATKALSDVICTSSNAVKVVESFPKDQPIVFAPDRFLGRWVGEQTGRDLVLWHGSCEVHERFTASELRSYRTTHPGIEIIAHPECPPDVLAEADYVGSTSGMIDWVQSRNPRQVVMVTECSMSDNVAAESPDTEFVRPCNLCPHMKRITLAGIRASLENLEYPVTVEPASATEARRSIERMLAVGSGS